MRVGMAGFLRKYNNWSPFPYVFGDLIVVFFLQTTLFFEIGFGFCKIMRLQKFCWYYLPNLI